MISAFAIPNDTRACPAKGTRVRVLGLPEESLADTGYVKRVFANDVAMVRIKLDKPLRGVRDFDVPRQCVLPLTLDDSSSSSEDVEDALRAADSIKCLPTFSVKSDA